MELELVPKDEPEKKAEGHVLQDGPLVYTGPERRKGLRRVTVDRREMVRFETKPERRRAGDRRMSTSLWEKRDF